MTELSEEDAMLVDLLCRRTAARGAKDYATADELRSELERRFTVDLNDRANTWRDAAGRVGTQDGPDFFEDRGARLKGEREERKRRKAKEKAAKKAAEDEGIGDAKEADDAGADAATRDRDPNAFVEWLRADDGPLKKTKPYAKYPALAERCIDIVEQWRLRFPKVRRPPDCKRVGKWPRRRDGACVRLP
jgi:hypothetical protein